MNIVIQCAATKDAGAGTLRTRDQRRVKFVADPASAPGQGSYVYAIPDAATGDGDTWRDRLVSYNAQPGSNPLGLLPAYRLYSNPVYEQLTDRFGIDHVFILSAGWGLIRSDFLTPDYDITFSQSAERYKRRRPRDGYRDFRMLPATNSGPLIFFGGKDYLPLFATLSRGYPGSKIAVYNSESTPWFDGVRVIRFQTTTRTNWHYEAVRALLSDRFNPLRTLD